MSGRLAGRWLSACVLLAFVSVLIAPLIAGSPATAQAVDPSRYDIGSPTLRDIWVDAARGSDSASGDSRAHALRTISAAWDIVPSGATLSGTGYRILLASGTYTSDAIPGWQEGHHGTGEFIRSGLAVA